MAASAHHAFEIVGLGQLVEATIVADRVVTFGA
jgi:sulfur relay (sulfurtransferase) complex TusBCD TusD component (DsrE family)